MLVTEMPMTYRIERVYTDEREKREPRPKADTTHLQVFELWGKYPFNWKAYPAQIQAAKNLLAEKGITECKQALAFYTKYKKRDFCPSILTPLDLDRKWEKLAAFNDKV